MLTLADIARALGTEPEGDGSLPIVRPAEPSEAGPGDLALGMDKAYAAALEASAADAAVVYEGADWRAMGFKGAVTVPRARYAMAHITAAFAPGHGVEGVHPSAIIDSSATLGPGVAVGPLAVIGPRARISAGCVIHGQATIGADAVLDEAVLVHPGVRIGPRCRVGARTILQPNCVIGGDGFSFVTPERSAVEQAKAEGRATAQTTGFTRIHSLGAVVLGADVEVGAGTSIDRGTVADTTVGDGTKIDSVVQIGHNVRIGRHCLLCGQAGVAGSSTLGDRVVCGGGVGVADQVTVGSDTILAGMTGVANDIPAGSIMMGYPAVEIRLHHQIHAAGRRLPDLLRRVRALEKRLAKPDDNG